MPLGALLSLLLAVSASAHSRGRTLTVVLLTSRAAAPALAKPLAPAAAARVLAAAPAARAVSPMPLVASALAEMPREWKTAIKAAYNKEILRTFGVEHSFSLGSPGTDYADRLAAGDEAARAMAGLGFDSGRDSRGRRSMRPPSSIGEFLERFERRVWEHAAAGRVSEDQVIRPALPFERHGAKPGDAMLYVRPGLDPWPAPSEWKPVTEYREPSSEEWYAALAAGRMPFFISHHDIGHVSEYWSRPEVMAELRRYAAGAKSPLGGPLIEGTEPPIGAIAMRRYILTEYLVLPNIGEAPLARNLMPEWFAPGGPRAAAEGAALLRTLPPEALKARGEALVRHSERLLLRLGGGARDYYNLTQHDDNELIRSLATMLGKREPNVSPRLPNVAARDSLHTVVREIQLLTILRHDPAQILERRSPLFAYKYGRDGMFMAKYDILKLTSAEELDALLAQRTAKLEAAISAAVRLELTPELVYREGLNDAPLPEDALSRRYVEAFASPGDAAYAAFLAR